MNLKKPGYYLFLFVYSFFFNSKLFSQAYFPILNNYSEWHVTNCFSGCATDKYYTVGDTILNGLHYTFLDKFHYNKNFVLREDTNERKVYLRLLAEPITAKEYLLYDFSLQVNDTMFISNPGSPFPKYAGNFTVDSIKLKPLLNSTRKFFYLHSLDTAASMTQNTIWVEGVGSLCLINTPGAPPSINGAGKLSCYFHNGIQEYQNLDSISNCISVYPLSINEITTNSHIEISQNFGTSSVLIHFQNQVSENWIYLYDITGKLIFKLHSFENKIELPLSNYSKGLFLLKIENDQFQQRTYKIVNP